MRSGGARLAILVLCLTALLAGGTTASARAADSDVGYRDQAYLGGGLKNEATSSKVESKLWVNDGAWWATMFDVASRTHRIFRLDRISEKWVDTAVTVDTVPQSRADALWDPVANKLYVVSHRLVPGANDAEPPDIPDPPVSPTPGRLFRFSYDAATKSYTRDPGFPVAVNSVDSETLTIAKDSTGTLWTTWTSGDKVWVNHTVGGDDARWATPYVLPSPGAAVHPDDVSTIVAFAGNSVGVMFSNQITDRFYFALHRDGADQGTAGWDVQPIPNLASADDHMNVKSDGAGRVWAVIKHGYTRPTDPLVEVLVRAVDGTWSAHPVALVKENATRPILLLDEQHRMIHTFYTGPSGVKIDGTIYEKSSPMDGISFPLGSGGDVVLREAASPDVSDATSTKQNVDDTTGMVVMASNETSGFYWHADLPLSPASGGPGTQTPGGGTVPVVDVPPPPPPPTPPANRPPFARFAVVVRKRARGFTATFDASRSSDSDGAIRSYRWTFGDGKTGAGRKISHTYPKAGPYTVRLVVTDDRGAAARARRATRRPRHNGGRARTRPAHRPSSRRPGGGSATPSRRDR